MPASIVSAEAALNLLRPVVRNSDTLHRKVLDQVLRSCRRLKAYAHHDAACGHTVKAAEAAAGDVAKAQQALRPLGTTACLKWQKVAVKAGATLQVNSNWQNHEPE